MKILLITSLIIIFTCRVYADSHNTELVQNMSSCKLAEDCLAGPELNPACFHYCLKQECMDAKNCPLFNKNFKFFPDCYRNLPCIESSKSVVCSNGVCAYHE